MNKSTCLGVVLASALAACGGGGGGGTEATPPKATTAGGDTRIFSEPVAMTCKAESGGNTCNAPTASFGGTELFQAALTNPQAGAMTTTSFGYSIRMHQHTEDSKHTAGSRVYDSAEEEVKLRYGAIESLGQTYTFDKQSSFLRNRYLRSPSEYIATGTAINGDAQPAIGYGKALDIVKGNFETTTGVTVGGAANLDMVGNERYTYIGLLTDRQGVVVPATDRIVYSGFVVVHAGDGSPLSTWFNEGDVDCPLEITINTSTGDITTPDANCSQPNGESLNFSLKNLVVNQSRVQSVAIVDSVLASGVIKSIMHTTMPTVPFTLRPTKIGGAVYGANADMLIIYGSGTEGTFQIIGNRVP